MTDLKKEKEVKKAIEEEHKKTNPLSQLREIKERQFGDGDSPTFTIIVVNRNYRESLLYFEGVVKILERKPKLTMADLVEMIKDSSVTLNQEAANELKRLIETNDTEGLLRKMLSMPEFRDILVQRLAA
jgi:hypothetical protein